MLDQNITTLLSTALGGTLAIIGGFLATYLTQTIANRTEKRKLTREKIEEVYTLINETGALVRHYAGRVGRAVILNEPTAIDGKYVEDFVNKSYVSIDKLRIVIELFGIPSGK